LPKGRGGGRRQSFRQDTPKSRNLFGTFCVFLVIGTHASAFDIVISDRAVFSTKDADNEMSRNILHAKAGNFCVRSHTSAWGNSTLHFELLNLDNNRVQVKELHLFVNTFTVVILITNKQILFQVKVSVVRFGRRHTISKNRPLRFNSRIFIWESYAIYFPTRLHQRHIHK
jgi:hypothetical protein